MSPQCLRTYTSNAIAGYGFRPPAQYVSKRSTIESFEYSEVVRLLAMPGKEKWHHLKYCVARCAGVKCCCCSYLRGTFAHAKISFCTP
jgi:hypothetical protein